MTNPSDGQPPTAAGPAVPSYDGRLFGPLEPGVGSLVGHYHQKDDLVWAEFGGGPVRTGRLVGVRDEAGVIELSYCQIMADGEVTGGRCTSVPTVLADGRVRLTEHWRRVDGSSGVSQIEELPPGWATGSAAAGAGVDRGAPA